MTESDLTTELTTGEEVPVRRIGEMYVMSYDHLPFEEFLHYVNLLLNNEGIENVYSDEDVSWEDGVIVDFGEYDDVVKVKFNSTDPYAISATVLECW